MHGTNVARALELLLQAAPAWVSHVSRKSGEATVTAAPPRADGTASRAYRLVFTAVGSKISVKEAVDAPLLPAWCPDRHINSDGSFCLGLRAGHVVDDENAARVWWEQLFVFLVCQETAHETRTWPAYAQLSHGEEAAQIQLQAEEIAQEFGLLEDFKRVMWNHEGVIAFVAERVDRDTMRPRNGRAACVCGRSDKRERRLLRRQCWKAGLKCLAVLERRRQDEVSLFWKDLRQSCCGTMDGCPLREAG